MDSDTVQAFLVEECVLDDGSRIERTDLYKRYEKYCEDTDRQSLTKNNFYKSLRAKGYKDFKTGGYRYFRAFLMKKTAPCLPQKQPRMVLCQSRRGIRRNYLLTDRADFGAFRAVLGQQFFVYLPHSKPCIYCI